MSDFEGVQDRISALEQEVSRLRTEVLRLLAAVAPTIGNQTGTTNPRLPYDRKTTRSYYYDPPDELRQIGRRIYGDSFNSLAPQLESNEVLFGVFTARNLRYEVATHLHSEDRTNEVFEDNLREKDGTLAPIEYYAVDKIQANRKTLPPIP